MTHLCVLASYNDYRQTIFDNIISPKNKEYCDYHKFNYIEYNRSSNLAPFRGSFTWNKWITVRDMIKSGQIVDGDVVIQQDADVINYDLSATYAPDIDKSFSISICSGNTFCHGIFGIRINEWSKTLIDNILSDELFSTLSNRPTYHEGFPNRPPNTFISEFREQAVFYRLFGIKRHSNVPFYDMENFGIHSDVDDTTLYTIDDFKNHVQILPVEYNITIWPRESDLMFYINKFDDKERVKFRHFTGSNWNVVSNWLK